MSSGAKRCINCTHLHPPPTHTSGIQGLGAEGLGTGGMQVRGMAGVARGSVGGRAAAVLAGRGQEGRGWGRGWGQAPMAPGLAQVGRSTLVMPGASLLRRLLSPERFSA